MVTLGLRATSPESQKARQISVMKKILEERSKMFSQEVCLGAKWGLGRVSTDFYVKSPFYSATQRGDILSVKLTGKILSLSATLM